MLAMAGLTFNNVDVIFVDVHEDNADAPSMLRAVQEQFGPGYTIVSNDGLEIKDGPGTRGTYVCIRYSMYAKANW